MVSLGLAVEIVNRPTALACDFPDVIVKVFVSAAPSVVKLAVATRKTSVASYWCSGGPPTADPSALQAMLGTAAVAVTGKVRSAKARMTRRM